MPEDVTQLLADVSAGDTAALDRLLPIVYDELRTRARQALRRERKDHTLSTTALVHEAYLKLLDHPPASAPENRAHFVAIAARAMRQILVNYAKARTRQKRGGNRIRLSLDDVSLASDRRSEDLLALDEALDRLEQMDERMQQIVEYRYFGGMTIEETAVLLDISPATVKRDWRTARAWLRSELEPEDGTR